MLCAVRLAGILLLEAPWGLRGVSWQGDPGSGLAGHEGSGPAACGRAEGPRAGQQPVHLDTLPYLASGKCPSATETIQC